MQEVIVTSEENFILAVTYFRQEEARLLRTILALAMALSVSLCASSEADSAATDACSLVGPEAAATALKGPLVRTVAQSYGSMQGCVYRSAGTVMLEVTVHPRGSSSEAKASMRSMIKNYGMASHTDTGDGLGDEATSAGRMLFVRKGDTIYTFNVVGHLSDDDVETRELAVAKAALR